MLRQYHSKLYVPDRMMLSFNKPQARVDVRQLYLLIMLFSCGCRQPDPIAESIADMPAATVMSIDQWEQIRMFGQSAGYSRFTCTTVQDDRFPQHHQVVQYSRDIMLSLRRFGQSTDQQIRYTSWETRDGQLLAVRSEMRTGSQNLISDGVIADGQLVISSDQLPSSERRMDWPREARSYFGVERSLIQQPLEAYEQRRLIILQPIDHSLAEVTLTANDLEQLDIQNQPASVRRVHMSTRLPNGQEIESLVWMNSQGIIVRSETAGQVFEVTDSETAIRSGRQRADITSHITIPSSPIANPDETRRIRYRMNLDTATDLAPFPASRFQQVTQLSDRSFEIVVTESKTFWQTNQSKAQEGMQLPAEISVSLESNQIITSDAAEVQSLAKQIYQTANTPAAIAVACEQLVFDTVDEKNFSTAFATAAEVARSKSGDCTEHAVLLAALCRTKNVPARVALGLIYVPATQEFAYHMWTEVYVQSTWAPLDATKAQTGTSACYIKIADASFDDGSPLQALLPVAKILGHVTLEVMEIE
ncbi:MAG: transglutaminase domain-containing protein [Planctomycetales bacterium]|nr:transglutaminase domain-containing protein [Planctomycetales bacterium]